MELIDWDSLPLAVLFICLFYLFIMVGAAASDYFCVNISTAAFHLPTSVAAILLSLANASPDLFSTFTAATNDGLNLAVGELIGSAAFVTTFVAGCIGLANPSMLHSSLFIKNISLFIILLIMIDMFMEFSAMPLTFSLLCLFYYFVYLMFILGHQNVLEIDEDEEEILSSDISAISHSAMSNPINRQFSSDSFLPHQQSLPLLLPSEEEMPFFIQDSSIVAPNKYLQACKVIIYFITLPVNLVLNFSCPIICRMDEIADDDSFTMSISELSWKSSIIRRKCQGFFGSLFVMNMLFTWFEDFLPFARITVILAILIALGVSLIFDQLPYKFVLICGVIISASIVQNSANIMVTILKLLCDKMGLSQGIVGLSIFALGNSLGDLVTNLTLAKMGHAQIAYAATLSSPVLCLSVGLGASTLYLNLKHDSGAILDETLFWLLRLLIANLIIFLILMKYMKCELNRITSIYLVVSYFVILTISMALGQTK